MGLPDSKNRRACLEGCLLIPGSRSFFAAVNVYQIMKLHGDILDIPAVRRFVKKAPL